MEKKAAAVENFENICSEGLKNGPQQAHFFEIWTSDFRPGPPSPLKKRPNSSEIG